MTLEIAVLFVILLAMAVMFFTELLPVDLTAFLGLLGLIYLGYLTPDEGFSGFSSPAVITMLSIFFLTGAIVNTGLGDMLATRLYKLVGGNELYMIMAIMLVGGILSAFIFNIAATAVLMPAVSSLARHSRISPSRLLMPLCFATVLGGTITMVGTPPNILAADILTKAGFDSFSLFSFAPIGLTLLLVGMLYMLFIGRKGLPIRDLSTEYQQRGNLAQTYQLQENLFAIRVPEDSLLVNKSLRDTHLGISFGVHVLAVKRGSKQMTAPEPDFLIEANDLLMVQGNLGHLQELLRVQGVSLGSKDTSFLEETETLAVCLARLGPNHPWIGQSAFQLKLRSQYHLTLAAIRRKEEYIHDNFSREIFKLGDELLLVGGPAEIKNLYSDPQLKIVGQHKTAMNYLRSRTVALKVPAGSELEGLTLKESKLGQLVGVTVVAVNREGHLKLVQDATFQLLADDQLVVCGDLEKVRNLMDLGQISIETDVAQNQLMSEEVGMVEVTLAPRSRAAGKNLAELKFRDKFGVQVIGLWREGHALLTQFAYIPLRIGDALLVQGSWQKIRLLGLDPDFVVLSTGAHAVRRPKKAGLAFLALILMITLVLFGLEPVNVSAFSAAALVVLFGAVNMEEAYRSVEWRVIFIVATILPVGIAMERTGAAQLVAETVLNLAGGSGPHAVLLALCLLASMLSQSLDGAPAVVLLAPVALKSADAMGISPQPLIMGIALCASAAFMTPFSHKANLLVMGAGGYKVRDYLKIGTPLTLIFIALAVLLTPVFFPFHT